MKIKILILITFITLILSCEKRNWDNPFDPQVHNNLPAPENFLAEVIDDETIKLSWDYEISGIDGFVIDKKINDGSWINSYQSLGDVRIFEDNVDLQQGNRYYYKIRAYWNEFNSIYSENQAYFTVNIPVFSLAGGTYYEGQTISISCSTPGAEIRYTIDGSEPTQSSHLYNNPIVINSSFTLKAKAFKDNWISSDLVSENYYHNESMIFVEGGSFSPSSSYHVTLSSFYLSKYEVTQSEWASVMTGNNNVISATPSHTSYGIGDTNPVNQVSWYDVMVYCNRRSIQEGLMPVYAKAGDTNPNNWGTVPTSSNSDWNAIAMNMSANGYRLPTEMEWEWAARGGVPAQQAGTFNTTYAGSDNIDDVAWYDSNSGSSTKPVGTKAPNELGLYDMSGNVREWCWDWKLSYPSGSITDPVGPNSGSARMSRGGGWYYDAYYCTVSDRIISGYPFYRSYLSGFRPLRSVESR